MARVGVLEAAVMDVLWSATGPLSVRAVLAELTAERELAYTTVMTVLERLHAKGLVARERDGKAWAYVPVQTRVQHTAALMAQALAHAGDRSAALVTFAGVLTPEDVVALSSALATQR